MLKPLLALALLALAACQPKAPVANPTVGDAFLGPAGAKVVLYEYGAPTCPGCKAWHDSFWEKTKSAYIDTNKVKFVFRETPSHNPPVDVAIFGLARCLGGETYFEVISEAFARQNEIERASRSGAAKDAMIDLGKKFGLNEPRVEACITDPKLLTRMEEVGAEGDARGVNATPTFFVGDTLIPNPTYDNIAAALDAALGAGQ
jgi:protein-disulfide isomerase